MAVVRVAAEKLASVAPLRGGKRAEQRPRAGEGKERRKQAAQCLLLKFKQESALNRSGRFERARFL